MNGKKRALLVVLLLAVFLRAWTASMLPEDFDEPVYLRAAYDYAAAIRQGDWQAVIDYPGVQEHPAFVKLLYGGVALALGDIATWTNAFFASRALSAIFGVLAVMFIALAVDPLSGGLLAVHTLAGKYTSQVYLEAVPHALTIAAVLALLKVGQRKTNRWFWLSAIALGAAAAGKYSYIPVTVVVLAYLLLFEKKTRWYWLLVYTSVAMVVFFVLDVSLWRDPFERLYQSLTFHMQYSQGEHVQQSGYPWYQPFTWIFTSSPAQWHPQVFFYFGFDGLISLLALPGIRREWKARRWLVVWLAAGALFLLAWPTKWPQYALTVTPPLCIMASATLRRFHHWARETENYWEYLSEMLPKPQKWFWWVVGALLLFVGGLYLTASIQRAVGRIGWSHLTPANSFLPGATVYDLQALPDGRMLIAASSGAALWSAPQATDETGQWTVYDHTNSGLPDSQVLSLGYVPEGGYWFGTASGAAFYDGETWLAYGADELGLGDGRVLSLAVSADGSVYAGTMSGASAWDGAAWTPIPQLAGQTVFALTLDSSSLWAGASGGAGRLSLQDGDWEFHPTESAVHDILVDPSGAVWAATSGSGLARLDGETWAYFRTGNSGLPYSMVNCLAQVGAGIWVGAASPANAGGLLAVMEGDSWSTFLSTNSGVSGSEPLVIVQSENGQVWIGTRTQGIDIYQPGR